MARKKRRKGGRQAQIKRFKKAARVCKGSNNYKKCMSKQLRKKR